MSVANQLKNNITQAYENLSSNIEGFNSRQQQRQMIGNITSHLANEDSDNTSTPMVVVQGPTGTGKTIGYLLSLIPIAQFQKKTLIISTATVALQEQLFLHDVPMVKEKSGLEFQFELVKGRKRYFCHSKLNEIFSPEPGNQNDQSVIDSASIALYDDLYKDLSNLQWDGERDSLKQEITENQWDKISCDAHSCSGRLCSFFSDCIFFKARQKVQDANVLIVNHDMLLTDQIYQSGILPEIDQSIIVLDEAHHIAEKVINHASQSYSLSNIKRNIEDAQKKILGIAFKISTKPEMDFNMNKINDLIHEIIQKNTDLQRMIMPVLGQKKGDQYNAPTIRFEHGHVPVQIMQFYTLIKEPTDSVLKITCSIKEALVDKIKQDAISSKEGEKFMAQLGEIISRFEIISKTWNALAVQVNQGSPYAKWIELRRNKGRDNVVLSASPTDASEMLNQLLWEPAAGIVLTSATLTTLGTFDHFISKHGLFSQDNAQYIALSTPFDYYTHSTLEIPKLNADPKNQNAHTDEVVRWINTSVDQYEGTLILFTSYRMMKEVYERLATSLQRISMKQGDIGKRQMIEEHCRKIDQGNGSILLGVDSMSEGVDLPGRYLSHVVITKLPFAVPSNPISETVSEFLESHNRNPFMEIMVPSCDRKLVQAVGRLIRKETDTGRIAVLDTRLDSKKYGQQMLASLPPMRRVYSNSGQMMG